MIQTSDLWGSIYADTYHQTRTTIVVDGVEIPDTRIAAGELAPTLTSAIYTFDVTVGNCVSSCFEFTYLPVVDPSKTAKVELFATIYPRSGSWALADETNTAIVDEHDDVIEADTAETILIGTFRISTRSKDHNGWLHLTCYDPMEKLDRVTVIQAAKKCGITLPDPCTVSNGVNILKAYTGMTCDTLPNHASFTREELEQMSMRTFAGYLAAQAGGSLASDETASHIRFLPLKVEARPEWYLTDENDNPVEDENGEPIFGLDEETQRYFLDGFRMKDLEDLGTLDPITGVTVIGINPEEDTYLSGTETGTVLEVDWPFASASKTLAAKIFESVEGYVHRAWNADQVVLDPAFQIGDSLVIGSRETVLAEFEVTIGGAYLGGAGAASIDELNVE